jgi:peptidoglycan hydrolase-like protein with peptidoglycan-binding domain
MQQIQRSADQLPEALKPVPAPAPAIEVRKAEPVTPLPPTANAAAAAPVVAHWSSDSPAQTAPAPAAAAPAPAVTTPAAPAAQPSVVDKLAPAPTLHNGPAPAAPGGAAAEPARLDRHLVDQTLGKGSKGPEVVALQNFLGIEGKDADGVMSGATVDKIKAWQGAQGLPQTGKVDDRTLAAMRGDKYIFGYSAHQDPDKFIPNYPMTAYHESGDMRSAVDPYATGAITHPTKQQDPGGKTYGTYQFESYTYPDGKNAGAKQVNDSTLSRFINWKDNPYGKEFQDVVAKDGIASSQFDALWKKEATEHNKDFGHAQEAFLDVDKAKQVQALFDKLGASDEVRKDPRLVDLLMGTTNQIGGFANRVTADVGAEQKKAGKPFTADQLGQAVVKDKIDNVDTFFSHSQKGTRDGIRERYNEELAVFQPPPVVKQAPPNK